MVVDDSLNLPVDGGQVVVVVNQDLFDPMQLLVDQRPPGAVSEGSLDISPHHAVLVALRALAFTVQASLVVRRLAVDAGTLQLYEGRRLT